ncbi:UNVERIFIED_CONTAM: hypothetical protein HDU68_010561, partial [Siphonaria sp. JEL0065]
MADLDHWSLGAWFYFNQLGYSLAIDMVNKNPDILPNTTIQVKRFNLGTSAMAVAQEIAEQHP